MRGGGYALDGGGYIVPAPTLEAGATQPGERRRFPLSQGELAFFYPSLADHLTLLAAYSCQQGASPLVDAVGARNLVQNQALLYARPGDPLGRASVEMDTADVNEFTAAADTAFFDLPAGANRSLILRFRCPDNAGAAVAIAGAGALATGARWGLLTTTAGLLRAIASDGTNSPALNTGVAVDDGLPHDAALVWDRTAGTPALRVTQDGAALSSTPLGALSVVDAPTGLRLGAIHNTAPVVGLQISYAAWLAGAMTDADIAAWRTPV